ncbi:MAG: anthranilate synthase component I [Anaerolineae bacterium]
MLKTLSDTVEMAADAVYHPSLSEFRELAGGQDNLIPVYREYPADLETPVSVYLKLMDGPGPSFLLESVAGGEQVGRYSFVGVNPRGMISLQGSTVTDVRGGGSKMNQLAAGEDFLDILKAELARCLPAEVPGLPRFIGGAVGYLGYDAARFFEHLPDTAAPGLPIPDAIFLLADTLVVFDHARHRLLIMSNAHINGDKEMAYIEAVQRIERVSQKLHRPLPAIPHKRWEIKPNGRDEEPAAANMTRPQYEERVEQAKEYIAAGDIFQVVLSQRLTRRTDAHPFAMYRALRMLNPSPYMFYFDFGMHDLQVIGASPEMHVRLEDGIACVRPIAGTRKRGRTLAEDAALAEELAADPKEQAEHVMLVDLGRNDVGRISEFGSVQVKEFMGVERFSHVMHLVSQVEGKAIAGLDAFDVMRATFPAGTVSGAPKVRAMEIIEELEGQRRGLYAGAVGYFGYDGTMDTCIAIRTMVVHGEYVHVQAGAGIVADSDPSREYEECLNKARALLAAVDKAESGSF